MIRALMKEDAEERPKAAREIQECFLEEGTARLEAKSKDSYQPDWFKIGKEVCQGCILSPYLFNLYVEYLM